MGSSSLLEAFIFSAASERVEGGSRGEGGWLFGFGLDLHLICYLGKQ